MSGAAGTRLVVLLLLFVGSTDASLFKRKRHGGAAQQGGPIGKGGKGGKGGKRGKVKEDVAWLLEDTSDGGWKPVRDDGHVQVWKRSMPNSDFVAIKSKASLAVSPQALFEVLTPGDIEIVRQYNPLVEDGSDLEVIDRDNKVSWSATMGIWPCRPRDFVTHIQRATLDDNSVAIVNSATTHPKAPVTGKYVRGEILHGVFHIKASKDKRHSELTMVHHFNPGGNIPPWLMNWLAEGKPITFVRKLEEVAQKWDRQAALTKHMPCKGRGFADMPCAFLVPSADNGSDPPDDALSSGGAVASGGEWGSSLAALILMALIFGGWVVLFGWPGSSKKIGEEKSSTAATSEGNRHWGQNGSPRSGVSLPTKHVWPETVSMGELSGIPRRVGLEAEDSAEGDRAKAVAEDSSRREAKYSGGPNGGAHNGNPPTVGKSRTTTSSGQVGNKGSANAEKQTALPVPVTPVGGMPGKENGGLVTRASPTSHEEPGPCSQDKGTAGRELGSGEAVAISGSGGVAKVTNGGLAAEEEIREEVGDAGAAIGVASEKAFISTGMGNKELATVGRNGRKAHDCRETASQEAGRSKNAE